MIKSQIRKITNRRMPKCDTPKCSTAAVIEDRGVLLCGAHGIHHMRMSDPNRRATR